MAEITVHDLTDGRQTGTVPLPGTGTVGDLSVRPEGGHEVWFAYTDFGTPPQVMQFDARTGRLSVWARGAARPSGYGVRAHQESFTSLDGTTVRMFVVAPTDRPRPTILFGYGGFGSPVTAKFSAEALAWVRAGGVFAAACVRGGGDEGEQWHRAGRGEHKQNSVDDFTAPPRRFARVTGLRARTGPAGAPVRDSTRPSHGRNTACSAGASETMARSMPTSPTPRTRPALATGRTTRRWRTGGHWSVHR